jgi:hypothetical protein
MRSPADRRPRFLNSALTFDVSQIPISKCDLVVPTVVSVFPDELYPAQRSWAERVYPKLIHYNKVEKGGHYAAGTAEALFGRGSCGLQIAAKEFHSLTDRTATGFCRAFRRSADLPNAAPWRCHAHGSHKDMRDLGLERDEGEPRDRQPESSKMVPSKTQQ